MGERKEVVTLVFRGTLVLKGGEGREVRSEGEVLKKREERRDWRKGEALFKHENQGKLSVCTRGNPLRATNHNTNPN